MDSCSHIVPHLECHETSVKTQLVSIDDDKICLEELIFMPESIRENNFTKIGTIIQFHKKTSPIQHMTQISAICTTMENIVISGRT